MLPQAETAPNAGDRVARVIYAKMILAFGKKMLYLVT